MLLKIGELAKRSGLTIRTLHHYDSIGLLTPSARSDAGYRLYDRNDVARLYRIHALRRLGLSLAEIGILLKGEGADLQTVIEQQIDALEQQVAQAVELRDRLKVLVTRLASHDEPQLDDWLSTLELMTMYRKYFTSDEIDAWRKGMEDHRVDARWPPVVAAVRDLMDRNISPASAQAQDVAKRWLALAHATMGDDPRFFRKLAAMHRDEPSVQALTGVDGAMLDFIMLATGEARYALYAKYFGPDQIDRVRQSDRRNLLKWQTLIAEVRQQMARGAAPDSPEAQVLVAQWISLFREAWGDDPAMRQRVRAVHENHPELLAGTGIDQEMRAFIERGLEQLESPQPKTKKEKSYV